MSTNIRVAFVFFVFLLGSALVSLSPAWGQRPEGFSFVQVTDTRIGFSDPKVNPDPEGTLAKVVAAINNLSPQPDFVVFTGNLTQTTADPAERRARMKKFAAIVSGLKVKDVKYLPGEDDAALDGGATFKEMFGPAYYAFEHKGVHFFAIDNASDPTGSAGAEQINWLNAEAKQLDKNTRVMILAHRPLFDLYPEWGWWTMDAEEVRAAFKPFKRVIALYGDIGQLHQAMVGNITFYSERGTMYPSPAPGSADKNVPVAWDAADPYKDLGFKKIEVDPDGSYALTECTIFGQEIMTGLPVITVIAKKSELSPALIVLKKSQPAALQLASLDVRHAFNSPDLGIKADLPPGGVAVLKVLPAKTGKFPLICDVYIGDKPMSISGTIEVED